MRILLVEDDLSLQQQIKAQFLQTNFTIDLANNGEEGLYLGAETPYDAAIVDIGLPKIDGLELVQQLRKQKISFPILMLTARSRWQDKVQGLEAGADDYLSKPFHIEELLARVNALIRRSSQKSSAILTNGPFTLNPSTMEVCVNNTTVNLSSYEYKVFHYLMMHCGDVISKTRLTEHIYEQDFDRDSNVIEVFIRRLRKKLDPNKQYQFIQTLRGQGYKLLPLSSDSTR